MRFFLSFSNRKALSTALLSQPTTTNPQPTLTKEHCMSDSLITPEFRAAFISVFRATAMKNADGTMSKAKFSIRAAFPPTANLTALKKEAESAAKSKWGDKIPKTLRSPFRINEELEAPIVGIGDDWVIMSFSANEDRRPGIVDSK